MKRIIIRSEMINIRVKALKHAKQDVHVMQLVCLLFNYAVFDLCSIWMFENN